MNGRVYDYNLGRFMSVDPFVHGGSQGINPYSYVFNNPLSGTDPTGYEPCKTGSHIKSGGDAGNCAATYDDNSTGKAEHQKRQSAAISQIAYNGNTGGSSDSDTMDIEGELEKATKKSGIKQDDKTSIVTELGFNGETQTNQTAQQQVDKPEAEQEQQESGEQQWSHVARIHGKGKTQSFTANRTIRLSVTDEQTFLGLANGLYYEIEFQALDENNESVDGVYPSPAFTGSLMRMLPDRVHSIGHQDGLSVRWTIRTLQTQNTCDNCGPPVLNVYEEVYDE